MEDGVSQFKDIPSLIDDKSEIFSLVESALAQGASDILLSMGSSSYFRIDGKLFPVLEKPKLTAGYIEKLVDLIINEKQKEVLLKERELDCSYIFKDQAFLRINVFYQKNSIACVIRIIPSKIRDLKALNLPESLKSLSTVGQGLVLITGPSGSGKSTTIAAILEEINKTRSEHILTIEDPIEYVFKPNKSIINQRELRRDTLSFPKALRSALRENFNVLFIGELRDVESIESALDIAETGHLVFATIHSSNAYSVPDRIINSFPAHSQNQVKNQLANTLVSVIAQKLIPIPSGGRMPVLEIMMGNLAIKTLIREGKTNQIKGVMELGRGEGMVTFDQYLEDLKKEGKIII